MEASMAQASPFKPIALVVEDDELQREMVAVLLEESEMGVIQCESAEAALDVVEKIGTSLSLIFTDVNLAGSLDGVELAHFVRSNYPDVSVIVTSGYAPQHPLPEGAMFMQKPWIPLELLREAERAQH
jgi:CheY-like chemotaxis protein